MIDRAADERLLEFLRLRARNIPSYVIAERFEASISAVDIACRKVLEADLKECQTVWPGDDPESVEPEDLVRRAYWKQRAPRRRA